MYCRLSVVCRLSYQCDELAFAALFLVRLRELKDSGATVVRPADFSAVLRDGQRSPAWLSGALRDLVDKGVLTDAGRGMYRFAVNGSAR